jgi:hypothetical protein
MKMKKPLKQQVQAYKLGVDRTELAKKPVKLDHNFAQSRDVHEDRGKRQMKLIHGAHTLVLPGRKMKK